MDKYMEQAIREAERFWYAFSVELRARYCQEEVEQHPDSPVAQFCLARASELRLLDRLRRMHDPEFCPYEECDACALLAQYKDVKTD